MSAALFTPGPWEDDGGAAYFNRTGRIYAGRRLIAEVGNAAPWQEDWQYNAALIAAAPDLYSALKSMAEFWAYGMAKPEGAEPSADDNKRVEELAAAATKAIAKVEGRTS